MPLRPYHRQFIQDDTNFRVGPLRMRQVRAKEGTSTMNKTHTHTHTHTHTRETHTTLEIRYFNHKTTPMISYSGQL
jgi:hypothetical protein